MEKEFEKSDKERLDQLTMAIMRAAVQAYHQEVTLRQAESALIGTGKAFKTKQHWLDSRIDEWLGVGDDVAVPGEAAPLVFGVSASVVVREPGVPVRHGRIAGENVDGRSWIVEFDGGGGGYVEKRYVFPK